MNNVNYRTKVLTIILLSFLVRAFVAFYFELGNDEAYYWLYSQHLYTNYFDHPPMVAFWIRLSTLNLWLDNIPGFLRLGSLISSSAAAYLMYSLTSRAYSSERAGFIAACFYLLTPYPAVTAGIFIMPDAPQIVFWTLSMYFMVRLASGEISSRNWIGFGIAAGLCIMSKVHGVFLWSGMGLYIIFHKREWFKMPGLYLAAFTTLIIISPIVIWNIRYDFITYRFHSSRVVPGSHGLNIMQFLKELLGQISFNNPFVFALIIVGFFTSAKRTAVSRILLLTGIPLAAMLLAISAFRNTLPHWSGPAYVAMLPFAAQAANNLPAMRQLRILKWNTALFVLFLVSWSWFTYGYKGPWVNSPTSGKLGAGDVTLDMQGWEECGEVFDQWRDSSRSGPDTLVSPYWWGAHVQYYFGDAGERPLVALGPITSTRHYAWVNELIRPAGDLPSNAWCIVPSDEWYDVPKTFGKFYSDLRYRRSITAIRGGEASHRFEVWELSKPRTRIPDPF